MRFSITQEQLKAGCIGWTAGIAYMAVAITIIDKKRVRAYKRTHEFNKRLVEEAWVYLPTEVKDKIQDEIKFYNIAGQEDI